MRALAVFALVLASPAWAQTPLIDAVKLGDAGAVKALLAKKADVNASAPDGTTALHVAIQRGDATAIDLLLRSGAKVSVANRYGVTPLQVASINGDGATITRLLASGADANLALPNGETPLMAAARNGSVAAIKALVTGGAKVDTREPSKGQTALMWAAADNNADAIKALVEVGADPKARSRGGIFSPLAFAVRGGHVAAARALLESGVDVNEQMPDGTSALLLAVINAHYEMAAFLLERGANPNADGQGWTALHQIAWSRRHNMGFNLPGPAATGGVDSLDLARRLVKAGADVNARQKKEPRDGNRNQLDRLGSTPFVMAAKSVDVPYMRTLLELGADPKLATNRGTNALMVAAGVGIWAPGENPGTPDEAIAAVKLCLEVGCGDVNAIDKDSETALHGAIYRGGNVQVAQMLIERGAKLDVVNKKGWTPLVVAEGVEYTPNVLKRYPEVAALLRTSLRAQGLPVPDPGQHASVRSTEVQ